MKTISPYVRILAVTIAIVLSSSLVFAQDEGSTSYGKGFRKEQNGWIYLHIEGAAKNRGEQMGYLMAREIDGYFKLLKASIESRQSGYDWKAYRE
ncbi:MAG: hypothetical protein NTV89_07745, partial [Proteobacteria bacterium]|nr:hypothetical protein [Pseudomonadota bacterium]